MTDNTVLIAIDPGFTDGGIAIRYPGGGVSFDKFESDSVMDLWNQIYEIWSLADLQSQMIYCYIEKVGAGFPGSSSHNVSSFARHCGHLDMALVASRIPHTAIMPTKWMQSIAPDRPRGKGDKAKAARKWHITHLMEKQFPDNEIFKYSGDAFGILAYLMKERGL